MEWRLDKFSRSIFLLIGDIYNARIVSTPAKFHASIYVSCHDTRRVENELWRSVSADIAMLSSPLSRGKIALFGHFVRRITLVRFAVNFCSFSPLTLSVDSFRSPFFSLSPFFSFLFLFFSFFFLFKLNRNMFVFSRRWMFLTMRFSIPIRRESD